MGKINTDKAKLPISRNVNSPLWPLDQANPSLKHNQEADHDQRDSRCRLNLPKIQGVLWMIVQSEDDRAWFIHIMASVLWDLSCVINGFPDVWFLITTKSKLCQHVLQFPQAKLLWCAAVNFHWLCWAGFWECGSFMGWYSSLLDESSPELIQPLDSRWRKSCESLVKTTPH